MVQFRILGPLEIWDGARLIDVGEPRRRAVMAALVVDAGLLVASATLIDRVWGNASPEQAHRSLSSHVTRIRRVLEQAAGGAAPVAVVNQAGGYRLVVERDCVDLHRFRHLVERARDSGCRDIERVEHLREAVGLWRGDPLTGVSGDWAARTREVLVQERLAATAAWAEAELRVANPQAVLGPLAVLADEYPLMEPLTAALVRALVAAGRPGEALARCRAHRQRLAHDEGLDQGPELQALYQAILRGGLGLSASPAVAPARFPVSPAQLPADVPAFAGRGDLIAHLDSLASQAPGAARAVVISTVSGTAGVGKTALAVHWAYRAADRFPDGQLYVNLRGFDPSGAVMDPAEAVRRFLDALNVPAQRIPADLDAQAALYRSLLAERRMVVVLDNARDSAQVRPLLPGVGPCFTVVTSRNQLTGLIAAGARPLALDLLTPDEAQQFLTLRLGEARVRSEPEAVDLIVRRCARLPLALALTAAHALIRPHAPLSGLAAELCDAQRPWDTLSGDDPASQLRTVFSWSYQTLSSNAARMFRLLGLHPGPDITATAAASLAAVPIEEVTTLLAELTRASLLTQPSAGRYAFHDLLRAYATELARSGDSEDERQAAIRRVLDHYLHAAHAADRLLDPTRDPITLTAARPGVIAERLGDADQAMTWFTIERPVLTATVQHAVATGFDTHAWQLMWTLRTFLQRRGHWHDLAVAGASALVSADRLVDPSVQAVVRRTLGTADRRLGRLDDAEKHLHRALDLYRLAGDHAGQAHTHHDLAGVWEHRGDVARALDHGYPCLELFRAAGHQLGQARALNSIGYHHAMLGDHDQALPACEEALTLFEELGDRVGQAVTRDSLGYTYHHLGRYSQAIDCFGQSLTVFREIGDRYAEAETLAHLGDTHHVAGDPDAARDAWRQALAILDDLDHPDAQAIRGKLRSKHP